MIRQHGARPRSFLTLAGVLLLLLTGTVQPAFAASFVVTKTADTNDGSCDVADCSLREAITAANAAATGDVITFAAGANGTITLSSALPVLANNGTLTITGNGAANTSVSGNNAVRVFEVAPGATVTISGVTITQGTAEGSGGGIYNDQGTLTVISSRISGNAATGNGQGGGGIFNFTAAANLTVINSLLTGNTSGSRGGGISNSGGTLTVSSTTISGNSASTGGGISGSGTMNLNNSIVAGNSDFVFDPFDDCENFLGWATVNAQNSLVQVGSGCGVVNGTSGNLTGAPALNSDFTLGTYSPAINAGSNALIPAGITTDLAGNARIQVATVDMGAYESANGPQLQQFVVTKTADTNDGGCDVADCSLREAITAANATGLATLVTFAPGANGTITLGSTLPVWGTENRVLTITGNGAANTIVSGNDAVRIFEVATKRPLTISRMTIANGSADQGGGILNRGSLTVADTAFRDNSATGAGNFPIGGAIFNAYSLEATAAGATLTLTNTAFTGNSATIGGGLGNNLGTATVNNSTFSGNSGGGIYMLGSFSVPGTLNLNNSIIADGCDNQDAVINARNSLIQGGLGCVNGTSTANLTADPALNGDLTLSSVSPAINAGDNALVPAGTTLDLAGNARIQVTTVDMGAFESAFAAAPTPTPTPSTTPTPTPSATPTKTPTPTPSATPTGTPTPSPTPSKTPVPTASPVPSATPQPVSDDYDGDGITDVAVYETATGDWSIVTSTVGPAQVRFGGPGFSPVPFTFGAYTSLGIYHVATGTFISDRGDETATSVDPFVPAEWLPAQADYDGDGATDAAVYNKVTGQWSYRRSSDDVIAGATLGGTGFLAVPADFDGDGKVDVAVYQGSNGAWTYIASSTGMQLSLGTFGVGGRFAPVPADYDGDGKADQALYQKKKGKWRFKFSTTGTTSNFTGIGGTGWLATPGDFDGDGMVDAGAYRKSTGGWRYQSSSTGLKTILPTLGGPGFVPVVGLRP